MDKNKQYYLTMIPDFILAIKGKMNAKNGDEVADFFVKKLIKKTEAYENQLCALVEVEIAVTRNNAAELLTDIARQKQIISRVPKVENGNTVDAIREKRKNSEKINKSKEKIENDLIVLSKLYEEIVSVDSDLNELIAKARKNCESKIAAYCFGVRKIHPDYEPPVGYDNDALKIYYSKHQMLDSEIASAVKEFKEV